MLENKQKWKKCEKKMKISKNTKTQNRKLKITHFPTMLRQIMVVLKMSNCVLLKCGFCVELNLICISLLLTTLFCCSHTNIVVIAYLLYFCTFLYRYCEHT
jgi:hypothetical protein